MGWATTHIARLKDGETISFRATGSSMKGRIDSGALVTVEPIPDDRVINVNDIVLCKVRGQQYLHIVTEKKNKLFQISNNHGFINGWTDEIYGRVIDIK